MTTRPTTTSEILARIDAMVPRLAERAAEAEALRRLPDATVRDADAAGFLAMLTPKRLRSDHEPASFARARSSG